MLRVRYVPPQSEVKDLLEAIEKLEAQEIHDRLKDKISGEQAEQVDEMCMDMHEFFIGMARMFNPGSESAEKTRGNIYLLASIFRHLAHELHRPKEESNGRFLELISHNPSAVSYQRK
jgi:hypothetical protein